MSVGFYLHVGLRVIEVTDCGLQKFEKGACLSEGTVRMDTTNVLFVTYIALGLLSTALAFG